MYNGHQIKEYLMATHVGFASVAIFSIKGLLHMIDKVQCAFEKLSFCAIFEISTPMKNKCAFKPANENESRRFVNK